MGLIEEVTKMQQQGISNQEISLTLQQQGIDKKKINDVLSHTAIKNAVSTDSQESPATISEYTQDSGMEQSVMNNGYAEPQQQSSHETQTTEYQSYPQPPSAVQEQPYPQEQQYQSYNSQYQSSDNVSEIAEQIFDEKISNLAKKVEFLMDIKIDLESKTESIDLRLQKIEKIIDRLQLSILQKVGEYMTNVEDIKKEMIETQKSFKSMIKDKV